MKRRNFLLTGAATVLGLTLSPLKVFAAEKKDIVALDDPTASALGYVHDVAKVDLVKFPKRATPEGKKQFCSNCMFAQGAEAEIAGEKGKWIGCQLFQKKVVNSEGWCNSWTAKPSS